MILQKYKKHKKLREDATDIYYWKKYIEKVLLRT